MGMQAASVDVLDIRGKTGRARPAAQTPALQPCSSTRWLDAAEAHGANATVRDNTQRTCNRGNACLATPSSGEVSGSPRKCAPGKRGPQ